VREYLALLLVALAVTYLVAVLAREVALRVGAIAMVRDRDVHSEPVPYLGGVAMYAGIVAAYFVARELPFLSTAGDQVFHDAGVVLVAGGMVCALGVVDDLIELDALTKFGGQLLASGFLVLNGVQFYYIGLPDGTLLTLDPAQAMVLTVIVVVSTINAVNFIDGLDGLAGGVIGLGAVAFFLFSYAVAARNGESLAITAALLCAALAGACGGFLAHNFNPARIFMGDSGSMLIGLTLAGSALTLTSGFPALEVASAESPGAGSELVVFLLPLLLPIAVLLLPFTDLLLAIARRTMRGESPFKPDKQHLHHRMLELGHSHRRAVVVMWLWAALIALGGVGLALYPGRTVVLGLAGWFVVTVVLTVVVPRVERPAWTHHEDYSGPPPRPGPLRG
jgi:UDP-GlcNAc:undecaprenyl-phosphate/decaprenyl-phosphate GlcNAc-1-phosphate transferase